MMQQQLRQPLRPKPDRQQASECCGAGCSAGFGRLFKLALLLAVNMIGAGALTLPHALRRAGWLCGSIMLALIATVCGGSLCVLATTQRAVDRAVSLARARRLGSAVRVEADLPLSRAGLDRELKRLGDGSLDSMVELLLGPVRSPEPCTLLAGWLAAPCPSVHRAPHHAGGRHSLA